MHQTVKHDVLRSVAHNMAASLASGICLLIGWYDVDVFEDAARSPDGCIEVDFLNGVTNGGRPSLKLFKAARLFSDALPRFCTKHGVPADAFVEFRAKYFSTSLGEKFSVTICDQRGRKSETEYASHVGRRTKLLDAEGRIRPKPVRRFAP